MPIRYLFLPAGVAVTHATTGALIGQGSSVAGSAAHIAKHATSGGLTGQGSVIDGTAARSAAGIHDTSGALTGQGSLISGTAAHVANHDTSGALQGSAAIITGSASGPVIVTNTYGGGGGTGGHKGWDRAEWAKKKEFEGRIESSLKEALTPADRLEIAQEIAPRASPEKLQGIAKTLTPKSAEPLALAPLKNLTVVKPDEDEERSIELLLEEDYADLHLLLPLMQKALRSL